MGRARLLLLCRARGFGKRDRASQRGYAAGIVFLPQEVERREKCKQEFAQSSPPPASVSFDGAGCRSTTPTLAQRRRHRAGDEQGFGATEGLSEANNRKLFLIRKEGPPIAFAARCRSRRFQQLQPFYEGIVYKGMLTAWQLVPYFKDLSDPDYKNHLAMDHSRFSAKTSRVGSGATAALHVPQRRDLTPCAGT